MKEVESKSLSFGGARPKIMSLFFATNIFNACQPIFLYPTAVTSICVQMMFLQDGEEGSEQTDEMLGVLTTEMAAYLRRVLPYFCS